MTKILDILQVGVGVPDLENFRRFARELLVFLRWTPADGEFCAAGFVSDRIAVYPATLRILNYSAPDIGGGFLSSMKAGPTDRRIDLMTPASSHSVPISRE